MARVARHARDEFGLWLVSIVLAARAGMWCGCERYNDFSPTATEAPPTASEAPPSTEAPPTASEAPPTTTEAPPTTTEAPPTDDVASPSAGYVRIYSDVIMCVSSTCVVEEFCVNGVVWSSVIQCGPVWSSVVQCGLVWSSMV